ncbi:hypothetical protein DSO57_1002193 [Entomophthora muscae]|uniref:Uncharacterized protein n=1 Tax=Entomophthora muscae TaxID=34485 RepID=A0ACC2U6M1_9FUNG|nr:hypothetical protein DSO57_1002193 [Entomophthora muscae]
MKLSIVLSVLSLALAQCSRPRVRKEIRDLTDKELKDFQDAVNKLHQEKKPGMKGMSSFEYFAYLHETNAGRSHSTASFLPWHRHYIRKFEMELQRFNPEVMLPYWDWSIDANEPHRSPVLSSKYMGGNGAAFNRCVRDGPFANWQMNYPTRHCLKRDYDLITRLSSFSSPESILLDINERRFSDFSMQFEIKHGRPHNAIGGRMGDFAPMHSPNEPLFFLHHAFVDLVWDKWQQRNAGAPYEGKRFVSRPDVNDKLAGFSNVTIASTLSTKGNFYCYSYPQYPRLIVNSKVPSRVRTVATSAASTSPFLAEDFQASDLDSLITRLSRSAKLSLASAEALTRFPKLRQPGNLTKDFIAMNRFNPKEVERVQLKEKIFTDRLNGLSGFRSISSLQAVLNEFM